MLWANSTIALTTLMSGLRFSLLFHSKAGQTVRLFSFCALPIRSECHFACRLPICGVFPFSGPFWGTREGCSAVSSSLPHSYLVLSRRPFVKRDLFGWQCPVRAGMSIAVWSDDIAPQSFSLCFPSVAWHQKASSKSLVVYWVPPWFSMPNSMHALLVEALA